MRSLGALQATDKLANTQFFLLKDFGTDIAGCAAVGEWGSLIDQPHENARRDRSFLRRGKAPDVKVTEVMKFPLPVPLQAIGLKFPEQPAERTARFVQDRKYRVVDRMLPVPSHEIASAIRTPHQIATSPRKRLASAYNEAMKNAPVRREENVSHSYVEKVL